MAINADCESISFHPEEISLRTFHKLLGCYANTVEQVHRRKMLVKMQPKAQKGSKRKVDKSADSGSGSGSALIQKTSFDSSEERRIREGVDEFIELDVWRYEGMPGVIQGRRNDDGNLDGEGDGEGEEGVKGAYFTREELVRIMEWKIKHGIYRPMLMGMIKGNQPKSVLTSTSTAIKTLPTVSKTALEKSFPNESINTLNTLRGVGPATSSLILSIATGSGPASQQVPFYSDDVYIWLCRNEYPEPVATRETIEEISTRLLRPGKASQKSKERGKGKLDMKYNIAEYRDLWRACWGLRLRLERISTSTSTSTGEDEMQDGGESESESEVGTVSMADIEKVAFVLRNIAVSGFFDDIDPQEILDMSVEQQESLAADLEGRRAVIGEERIVKGDEVEEDQRQSKRKKN